MKKLCFSLLIMVCLGANAQTYKTRNIFLITLDGFRWQEVFNGPDSTLLRGKKLKEVKSLFWTSNPVESRMKPLPFFWNEIAAKGELYGNRSKGNLVNVTNKYWF